MRERMFNADGTQSDGYIEVANFCIGFHNDTVKTEEICAELSRLSLFKTRAIRIRFTDGGHADTGQFRMIDEDALNAASDKELGALIRSGAMALIYAHLASLDHIARIGGAIVEPA